MFASDKVKLDLSTATFLLMLDFEITKKAMNMVNIPRGTAKLPL